MKILAFADVHGDRATVLKLVARAKKDDIDVVVCAGDFTVFEGQTKGVLKDLDSIGKTVLIIPGNHESPKSIEKEIKHCRNLISIHKKMWKHNGIVFLGWGTDGFSRRNSDFRDAIRSLKPQLGNEKIVLVTHAPPHGTSLDRLEEHVGNKDIRAAIERIQPVLAVSGHIHETEGKQYKIGKTLCVNPGWKGMVLTV
ncbi:MAG TPA: metallophosphoesterase [Candidatus Nanoarchaeia archaeon]|nr:metallophosphoesterase [Candidatus Nanoarchaeia archaeon]